ncbi:16275_t:CDS:2 [Cetraspora pellucida]|uniref:16275_t:CDS:1 n=1 Tax=Cetraspora pellucida TaxID=1433469 RepID=A0A9N9A1C7_9GLOM|nr:16275_t:CDS:2 [Cetraspora pellucida]
MARMDKCCGCIPMRAGVITIAIFWLIIGIYNLIQNIEFQLIAVKDYYSNVYKTLEIVIKYALIINSLTILVTVFGIIVVCSMGSARLLKIFLGLYILIIVLHLIHAIYFTVVISSYEFFDFFIDITIKNFIGPLIGIYFAKVIADYIAIVESATTSRTIEDSEVANNQVVTNVQG